MPMRGRVHIKYPYICVVAIVIRVKKARSLVFLCLSGMGQSIACTGREGGVEIPSRNVGLTVSRTIPGAVRTFARER